MMVMKLSDICFARAALLLVLCVVVVTVDSFQPFDCSAHKAWPVTTEDNHHAMVRFQNTLAAYQHRCSKNGMDYAGATRYEGGIGFGTVSSVVTLMESFENYVMYRPYERWIWSEANSSDCNTPFGSADCHNIPLTYCWYKSNVTAAPAWMNINYTDAYQYIPNPSDICTIGIITQKSLLWVFGQMIHYHIRLPPALEHRVETRVQQIFPKHYHKIHITDPITGLRCLSASLHIRGGEPDGERKPLNGTEHLRVLEEYNHKLKAQGSVICKVYISGDHLEDSIFFPNDQIRPTPGNYSNGFNVRNSSFEFMALPRFVPFPGEVEPQLEGYKKNKIVTMQYLYQEYMEDLRLHAHADIFIGSTSNLMFVVGALRQAYHPHWSSDRTCFLESHDDPPSLVCLNSKKMIDFYQLPYKGFNGGTIFFPDTHKHGTISKAKAVRQR